jgi:hypothetical protein
MSLLIESVQSFNPESDPYAGCSTTALTVAPVTALRNVVICYIYKDFMFKSRSEERSLDQPKN